MAAPQAGMLIRYFYLWSGEAELGGEEGVKDRPCAVVIVTKGEGDKTYVRVLPVNHRPPLDPMKPLRSLRRSKIASG